MYVTIGVCVGGLPNESSFVSGLVMRKNVVHKNMPREVERPRILLLAGGIDFDRQDVPRLSSLDTLVEQELQYLQILVDKIMSLKPGARHWSVHALATIRKYLFLWQNLILSSISFHSQSTNRHNIL